MSNYNDWKQLRCLGEGGQGQTFLVQRAIGDDKGQFVLKRLKNSARSGRFQAEIDALSRLEHRNIVRIVEHGEHKGKPYLVMEYCECGDLGDLDLTPLSLSDRLSMFRQICDGVAAAHRSAIVHR